MEAVSTHTEYTKYTHKQAHKQVLAVYFHHTYKTRKEEVIVLLPKILTINHITCLIKTETC